MIKKYIVGETFLVVLMYVSFSFINYTIFQGYILALVVFILGIINFFIIHNYETDFPFKSFMIFKKRVRIENYRMVLIGGLFMAIGLVFFFFDKTTPFPYISFSTGIFFISFVRIKLV